MHRNVFEPSASRFLVENGYSPRYPDGKRFAVCLTHDIDAVYPKNLDLAYGAAKALVKGNFKEAFKKPFSGIYKKWNPLWNFKEIMDLEARYGARSSIYFLAQEPKEPDFNFKIEDLKAELKLISGSGWEVGLHGGHGACTDLEEVRKKKQKLEKVLGKEVIGYRNHYLRFKVPKTWELLRKAGFKYDSTFGYNDCAGFRNGMCHPFKPFDLNTGQEIDILEIPLTVMDRTLFDYMKLDFEKAWQLTAQLIDTVEECQGIITVLWHNTEMQGESLRFYEKILQYCSEKKAWLTSGEEIYGWWKNNVGI